MLPPLELVSDAGLRSARLCHVFSHYQKRSLAQPMQQSEAPVMQTKKYDNRPKKNMQTTACQHESRVFVSSCPSSIIHSSSLVKSSLVRISTPLSRCTKIPLAHDLVRCVQSWQIILFARVLSEDIIRPLPVLSLHALQLQGNLLLRLLCCDIDILTDSNLLRTRSRRRIQTRNVLHRVGVLLL